MVSALTDRLWSGYSSSGGSSNEAKPAATTNDSSGYSADQEQSAQTTAPPFYIDLLSHHGKRHASDDHHHDGAPDEKKRRLENQMEVNYLAHTARHEISRGGRSYPTINTKKPRVLPVGVDYSHVTLVHSKDFFMPPRKPAASSWNMTMTMSPDLCMDALQSIIKSCSSHYRGVSNPPVAPLGRPEQKTPETEEDSSDVASTTSSVTEDGDDVAPPKTTISMGQALSISKQPRYVLALCPICRLLANAYTVYSPSLHCALPL